MTLPPVQRIPSTIRKTGQWTDIRSSVIPSAAGVLCIALGQGSAYGEPVWPAGDFHHRPQVIAAAEFPPDGSPDLSELMNRASRLVEQGRFEAAADLFDEVARRARSSEDHATRIVALLNSARARIDGSSLDGVLPALDEARQLLQPAPSSAETAAQLASLGELYHRADAIGGVAGSTAAATQSLLEAAAMAAEVGADRSESLALGHLGAVAERFGELQKGLDYSRLAIDRAQSAGALDSLYRWQWQSARLLEALGRDEQALSAYQLAIETLEKARPGLARRAPGTFETAVAPVFFGMANLLLRIHGQVGSAAAGQANLFRVRRTIERLRVAEVEDYFAEDCVVTDEQAIGLDQLAAKAAVIYPVIFEDRLEVLTSYQGIIRRHTQRVGRAQLTLAVNEFRRSLVMRNRHGYWVPGRRLYDWLIRPQRRELEAAGIDTLILVPDGPLRTVPPAAFVDGDRFLIQDFAVATSLGLTLTSPRSIKSTGVRVLAGGLTKAVEGFSPLPAVANELARIRSLYPSTELRDEAFRVDAVTAKLAQGDYSIVHIATHGQFLADFRESFLLAYDGRVTMDRLEETVGLRRYLNEPVELLMLSACETAVGDERAALGLAGVALKAGARSAVATLWSINDEATAEIVGAFYSELRNTGVTKAEALRRAQLAALDDRRYRHPALWSPFLLLGNWL